MVVYIEKGADLFEKILSNYNLFLLISHTQKLRSESFWFTGKNSVYTRTLFFFAFVPGVPIAADPGFYSFVKVLHLNRCSIDIFF